MANWKQRKEGGDSGGSKSRSDWRKPKGGAAGAEATRDWQKSRHKESRQAVLAYRLKLAAWGLAMVALVGVLGYLLFLRPKQMPLLAVAVLDYRLPVPPNAYAREDLEALGRLGTVAESNIKYQGTPRLVGGREDLLSLLSKQLDDVVPGGPGKNVIVVYLSALGVIDENAEPALLLSESDPLDRSTWLPVSELLSRLKSHDKFGSSRFKKLLVLDCCGLRGGWSLGQLHPGFAARLEPAVQAAAIPQLYVLCSASSGQEGWAAPELNGTVFGQHVAAGLAGLADGASGSPPDGKVSLLELRDFVAGKVAQWVTEYRADRQMPMLLSEGAGQPVDFPLVYAKQAGASPSAADDSARTAAIQARLEAMGELWQRMEAIGQQGRPQLDPVSWAEWEHKLLRLEQLALAGEAYAEEFNTTKVEVEAALARPAPDGWPTGFVARSFPWTERLSAAGNAATSPIFPAAAPAAMTPAAPAPAGPAAIASGGDSRLVRLLKVWRQAQGPPKPAPEILRPESRQEAALVAWTWLCEDAHSVSRPLLSEVLKYIDQASPSAAGETIEIHFLRELAADLPWPGDDDLDVPEWIKLLVLSRRLSEQAASPADERALYWISPAHDAADATRRALEDATFIHASLPNATQRHQAESLVGVSGQGGAYRRLMDQAQQAARTFRLRDAAWAEGAYLAQWVLERARRGQAEDLYTPLERLIAATHRLGADLDRATSQRDWPQGLVDREEEVRGALKTVRDAYFEQCRYLLTDAGEDRQTLREIGEVLATPLVTGLSRKSLRDAYVRIMFSDGGARPSAVTASRPGATGGAAPAFSPGGSEAGDRYLELLTEWGTQHVHPALAILDRGALEITGVELRPATRFQVPGGSSADPAAITAARWKRLAEQGGQVRSLLGAVRPDLNLLIDVTRRQLRAGVAMPPVEVRLGLSKADRLVRAAAPLLAVRSWQSADQPPTSQLRSLDRYYLALWQGRRTLEDFWDGEPGFDFATVCGECIELAKVLGGSLTIDANHLGYGSEDLRTLLKDRQTAAATGVRVAPEELHRIREPKPVAHAVIVEQISQNLPRGEAGLLIRYPGRGGATVPVLEDDTQKTGVPRRSVSLGEATARRAEVKSYIDPRTPLENVSQLDAVLWYRGHEWAAPFTVHAPPGEEPQGPAITVIPPVPVVPRITVKGDARQEAWVMLVLDCSISMKEKMILEGRERTRLDVARQRLDTILRRLPDDAYHVGLRLYGHRAGWKSSTSSDIVRAPGAPPRLHPAEDVEMKIGLTRLNDALRGEVRKVLEPLVPWGETPLYYALKLALNDFEDVPPELTSKQIIVITDGVNFQSPDGPKQAITLLKDVEDMKRDPQYRDIRIDIVGLDMDAAARQNPKEIEDLIHLAGLFGGQYHRANDPSSLLTTLEKLLNVVEFSVNRAGQPPEDTDPQYTLGTTWIPPDWQQGPQSYDIRLHGIEGSQPHKVTLWSGDALELFFDKQDRRLEHRRWNPELSYPIRAWRDNLGDPHDPEKLVSFFVGAHKVEQLERNRLFRISIQNNDEWKFSPRPLHYWAEITPVFTGVTPAEVPVYHFYDRDFEPYRPVPVLRLLASNWPKEAVDASVRLWFKTTDDVRTRTFAVDQYLTRPIQDEEFPQTTFRLEIAPRTDLAAPESVIVTEEHAGGDLYTVRVEMTPPADRIEHLYLPHSGRVRHVFVYNSTGSSAPVRRVLLLTPRREIMNNAVRVDPPLQVPVPGLIN